MTDTGLQRKGSANSTRRTGAFRLLTTKMLLAIWVGIPFISGLAYFNGAKDQKRNVSIYSQSLTSQHYTITGILNRPDPRGRHLSIRNYYGETRVYCSIGFDQSSCLFGSKFPLDAKVNIYDYKINNQIYPIIISVRSRGNNILTEKVQYGLLKDIERREKSRNVTSTMIDGAVGGIGWSLFITLMMIFIGWAVKVRHEGAN